MTIYSTKNDSNIFKQCRVLKGYTQNTVAQFLNIDRSTVSKWESGAAMPDQSLLSKIADLYNVSIDYLLGRSLTSTLPSASNVYPLDAPIKLPIYGEIRAGTPIYTDQSPTDEWVYEDATYSDGNHFVLRVVGSSMEPEIKEGALAIIRHQNFANKGQIVACLLDGDVATLKQYMPQANGSVLLKAFNPEAESYVITEEQLKNNYFKIIGVVREIKRKYY